ncbi:ATP-binding cassette domain-containing protein [Christiangramia sp. OXR-203]|uniref:ATP-binding cassette domain-containing protein n=1 Tax=Christiangramia sp. OXR-203 TaxID=3100176 RepID=UPI002AC916AB|nr:ATP-binding cassette domain-containing protein [Christiangramia sp. OXR-203]WPY98529.1 ATP-binding cassette domain-containing protein [Christiangramia sp. OXR-203]
MRILQARNIQKSYADNILNDLNFQCKTGEMIGIFGRNGSGKSTLLKILFGKIKPDQGSIYLDERELTSSSIISEKLIGCLPQDSFLPKNSTVQDIIPFFHPDGEAQDRIFYAKGVGNFASRKIKELAIGQRRYLELLLVGNLDHPFLLLDEPFSMVEPLYKECIIEFITNLKARKGIIITDHYYQDVLNVASKNFLLKNGNLVSISSEADLLTEGYLKT